MGEDFGRRPSTPFAENILGKSGRAMLDALVAATTDPQLLAELARGKLRAKIPACVKRWQGVSTLGTR